MELALAEVKLRHPDTWPRPYRQVPERNHEDVHREDPNSPVALERVVRDGLERPNRAEGSQLEPDRSDKRAARPAEDIRIVFYVDERTRDIAIRVIDGTTGEVVRHVPPEELLSVMQWLSEFADIVAGLVMDEKR